MTGTGRIQPKTQVNISADVSAKITRLDVEEGDWVEKGAFLVELDRERYLAALESAEANLRVAQADADVARENMNKAEKDYARVRELHDAGLETPAQLDATQAMFEAEKARRQAALDQVEQVRADLKRSRDDLSKTRIYAPMAGTISQLNKEVGEIALGSQFQEDVILVISNLEGMEAQVQVDENDIVSVAVGDTATIEVDALPEVTLDGVVTEIANTARHLRLRDHRPEDRVRGQDHDHRSGVRAAAGHDRHCGRRHGRARGRPGGPDPGRGRAHAGAAGGWRRRGRRRARKWEPDKDGFVELVFVVAGGTAEARQVRTGIQSETHIEIVEGLSEGEQIVVGSYRAISRDLRDGSNVVVSDEPAAEAPGPN